MGDSYEEIMTTVNEKNLKQQNLMILKSEALSFAKPEELLGNLVFLEYQEETSESWLC